MTLVDTSVWIDFFRGEDLPHVACLERLIREGAVLALCGVILTEVLQGIRSEKAFETTRSRLQSLDLLQKSGSAGFKNSKISQLRDFCKRSNTKGEGVLQLC